MFKGKTENLDTKSELCYFVGYPKGTKNWLFYGPREHIVLVNTNTILFLEGDYMKDRKLNDRFDFRELSASPKCYNSMKDVPEITVLPLLDTRESRRSERIIKLPNQFIFLGKVVSDEHDLDPSSYNEAIFDKNPGI